MLRGNILLQPVILQPFTSPDTLEHGSPERTMAFALRVNSVQGYSTASAKNFNFGSNSLSLKLSYDGVLYMVFPLPLRRIGPKIESWS